VVVLAAALGAAAAWGRWHGGAGHRGPSAEPGRTDGAEDPRNAALSRQPGTRPDPGARGPSRTGSVSYRDLELAGTLAGTPAPAAGPGGAGTDSRGLGAAILRDTKLDRPAGWGGGD